MKPQSAMPDPPSRGVPTPRNTCSVVLAVVAIGLGASVVAFILGSRDRFTKIFDDFGTELPVLTTLVLGPALPIALAAVVLLTAIKEAVPGIRLIANIWNAVVICLALACLAAYVAGVFGPLIALIDRLQ